MRRAAAGAAVLAGAGIVWWAAAAVTAPPEVASRIPVVITASSIDVGRLVYRDTVDVQTAAGPVAALELGLDDPTFHELDLSLPCVPTPFGGLTGRTTGDAASAAGMTIFATDVVVTIDGTPVRLSSADPAYPPPPPGTVLVSDGTLGDPTLVSALLTATSFHATGTRTTAFFCTPHGKPSVTGGVPFSDATPSEEPSEEPTDVTPSPSTEPTPTAEASDTSAPTTAPTPSPTPTQTPTPASSPEPSPTTPESSPSAAPAP